ncbi:MAG: hypothetical protein R3A51_22665 [Nannocystaceae bacterium]
MFAALLVAGCGGGAGEDTGSDSGDCPGGVCLTEDPSSDSTSGSGTASTSTNGSGTASTSTTDATGPDTTVGTTTGPDGVCDPAACTAWDIADPSDGTAQRVCGDPDCETTTPLPALDENYFRCKVMPVFQEGCGFLGCHSPKTPSRQLRLYQRWHAREEPLHSGAYDYEGPNTCPGGVHVPAQCGRHPITALEWANNFDSARLFALGLGDPADSALLQQPLLNDPSGLAHDGIDVWRSTSDARYKTVLGWLQGQTSPADCGGVMLPNNVLSFDYFQFPCPQCGSNGNCTDSGQSPPCDPNACLP